MSLQPGSAPGPTLGDEYGKTLPSPFFTFYLQQKTERFAYERSGDEGRRHAADAGAHRGRADADVANLGGKQFAGMNVDDRERDADHRLPEDRQRRRHRAQTCRIHRLK